MNETEHLFFYPAASEYRKLTVGQMFTMDADGVVQLQDAWWYEWTGQLEREGFASADAAYADGLVEGQKLYPGIVPATGKEGAYGAEWHEDTFDR